MRRATCTGFLWATEETPLVPVLPFNCYDDERNNDPLQGLRQVPFLGQVCKQWKQLLEIPLLQVREREAAL